MGQKPSHQQHLYISNAMYSCMNGIYKQYKGFPSGRYGYQLRCTDSCDVFYIEYKTHDAYGWYLYSPPNIGHHTYRFYYNPSDSMTVPLDGWYLMPRHDSESKIMSGLKIELMDTAEAKAMGP